MDSLTARAFASFFLLALSLLPNELMAQPGVRIVVEEKTKQPLSYVSIKTNLSAVNLISNEEGKLMMPVDASISYYDFYKVGYVALRLSATEAMKMDTIRMQIRPFELNEIEVNAEPVRTV